MLSRIRSWLSGWPNRPRDKLEAARVERLDAILLYRRAKARGATRAIHHASQAARRATAEVVRLELGR